MSKPVIATAHFTGCFGCHMSILDIDERILDLVELVEFNKSPINDIKNFTKPVDIGIIEGGISNDENAEILMEFRKHCKILVAIGACALTGGVPSMRNLVPLKECLEEAYLNGPTVKSENTGVIPNDPDIPVLLDKVYPCHEVVKIDYFLPGCPPSADTIWNALVALLKGEPLSLDYELIKFD
ncbi:MAG TPA: NADP oxidoreductase [Candidatus Hydrogenedens sp.]|nr:NADP oxidoreductase [Candidatus Hydrogenedens sp.]HOK09255.1 NADP oxidoreductase [Candidatus Hydrogenedens sp.]HOL20615.1 NADP oxidoreductase [Candidatus Hydrogenedens sp.]HPP59459.1 NADP oxidoreductase [Candidatus Hydrogenedens sp.]